MNERMARMVVVAVACLCGISLVGSVILAAIGVQSPPALAMVIGSGFGLLVGLPIIPRTQALASPGGSPRPVEDREDTALILVVDDSASVRITLKALLSTSGYEVRGVATGEEALQLLDSGLRPDLILLDMILPGMDGNEFLETLQTRKETAPVVILSAYVHQLRQELKDRVSVSLTKPPNAKELLETLRRILPSGQTVTQ